MIRSRTMTDSTGYRPSSVSEYMVAPRRPLGKTMIIGGILPARMALSNRGRMPAPRLGVPPLACRAYRTG